MAKHLTLRAKRVAEGKKGGRNRTRQVFRNGACHRSSHKAGCFQVFWKEEDKNQKRDCDASSVPAIYKELLADFSRSAQRH